VGDVCGHDVEGAALGVELRVSWRALTLAGVADEAVLSALEQVLASERRFDEIFATIATVRLDLARSVAVVRLAGHPPPLLIAGATVKPVSAPTNRLLGVRPAPRPAQEIQFDSTEWALFLYTDGLIEGRYGDERLDVSGLVRLVEQALADGVPLPDLAAWLVGRAEELNGGPLADDVAALLLTGGGAR
jgi:serine phosphatase RsbU (regulator of sigma subunit)